MPVTAVPNVATQLERAIAAWLADCGAGTPTDIYISNDPRDRAGLLTTGITDVRAHSSVHSPEFSMNEVFQVTIQCKFGAALQPGQANKSLNRITLDNRVGMVKAAMCQTANSQTFDATITGITASGRALKTASTAAVAAANTDMDAFECIFVRYVGCSRGRPDDDSCAWVESLNFEITAAPAAIN